MNVNLEYYKIFYYVAKLNGITNAAEELCISQPAVSQAIKQLEKTLGSKLFIRTPKGARLTPEGEVLYSYIKRGYEYIKLGENTFQKMLDLEQGEIRIGASDMTLEFYLLPYLEKFHESYPKIKVTVTNAPTPETIEYLYAGKIDFGIVSTPFDVKPEITVTKVKEIEDIFIGGSKFGELKKRIVEYKELENLPIICLEHNTSTRKYIDEYLLENKVILKPEFELATSDMIVQFAMRNLGLGCVVKDFASKYLETGEVFEIEFTKKIPKRHICTIMSTKNPISTAAKILLDMME
ncbi:DNA-binding transcriptional LysR family regulator [Mobilisporobacter senegalensis]|uniref:DNA-binding transcriptional LysR family regulator n=1 Tax=Mobilisporobacter senegalensis TaxID=1329262 RepID=A0A3N1XKZ2_9FIRM|nr:LysR family transcriptional regulator [Mobilisporobacter senegalensis]ROR27346.1 DNA-binding transcriptional LysR family regulator [Mobilisporobacter senegalensis]